MFIYPTKEKFLELAPQYGRITVYREITGDTLTPIALLRNFSNEKNIFLLESANLDKTFSRYSFFGRNPKRVITFKNGTMVEAKGSKKTELSINPADYLASEFYKEKGYNDGLFGDFSGGFVGFFGYDAVNYMGVLRKRIKEDTKENIIGFFEVEEFYVFDNHKGKLYAACSVSTKGDADAAYRKGLTRTADMEAEVHALNFDMYDSQYNAPITREYEEPAFVEAISAIKSEITAGEAIQVVFSSKHEIEGNINPVNFYRSLRMVNPSPYMFFLKFGDTVLCGSSPEIHLKVKNRVATLKPIAGTYPVTEDIERDKSSLLADPKERAEHLMLVDLARNDLYAGCDVDSVKVVQSFSPEVYSHVVHIVSEVQGKLRDDETPFSLFMKTFPAGTVSGAPKVRAMELIDQYETCPRGFYAGCVGYFGYSGNLDTAIIIRSALVKKNKIVLRAGAGVVYDSVPETEFLEVDRKLKAMFAAYTKLPVLEGAHVSDGR